MCHIQRDHKTVFARADFFRHTSRNAPWISMKTDLPVLENESEVPSPSLLIFL